MGWMDAFVKYEDDAEDSARWGWVGLVAFIALAVAAFFAGSLVSW